MVYWCLCPLSWFDVAQGCDREWPASLMQDVSVREYAARSDGLYSPQISFTVLNILHSPLCPPFHPFTWQSCLQGQHISHNLHHPELNSPSHNISPSHIPNISKPRPRHTLARSISLPQPSSALPKPPTFPVDTSHQPLSPPQPLQSPSCLPPPALSSLLLG